VYNPIGQGLQCKLSDGNLIDIYCRGKSLKTIECFEYPLVKREIWFVKKTKAAPNASQWASSSFRKVLREPTGEIGGQLV
jgi:hypothetical protein